MSPGEVPSQTRAPEAGETADYLSCRDPESGTRILLNPAVVDRLQSEAFQSLHAGPWRGSEIGGLLLGRRVTDASGPSVIVQAAELLPIEYRYGPAYVASSEDREKLAAAAREKGGNGMEVLGLFRSHIRAGLRLFEEDLALARACFPESEPLILLILPFESGLCSAAFFLWQQGRLNFTVPSVEMPFVGQSTVYAPAVRTGVEPAEPAEGLVEAPAPAVTGSRRRPAWILGALAALLIVAATGAGIYSLRDAGAPAGRTAAPLPAEPVLGLTVKQSANQMVVTWDRTAPVLRSATGGVLSIEDGDQKRILNFDPDELMSGSLVYVPATSDVQFRLQVSLQNGRTASEMLRVLSARGTGLAPQMTFVSESPGSPAPAARFHVAHPAKPVTASAPPPETAAAKPVPLVPMPERRSPETEGEQIPQAPSAEPVPTSAGVPAESARSAPLNQPEAPQVTAPPSAVSKPAPAVRPTAPAEPHSTPVVSRYRPPVLSYRAPVAIPPRIRTLASGPVAVEVRMSLSADGKVEKAEIVSTKGTGAGFLAQFVLSAARMCRFEPAALDGKPVPSEHVLTFRVMP